MRIKNFPPEERPRERCLRGGASILSLRECLAIVLGSGPRGKGCLGMSEEILKICSYQGQNESLNEIEDGFFSAFETTDFFPLEKVMGMGKARLARLQVTLELGRRYANFRDRKRYQGIDTLSLSNLEKNALQKISQNLRSSRKEWLGFVPVHPNGVLGEFCLVAQGSNSEINVDIQELFAKILILKPFGVFLFHNHPTRSISPSSEDILLTGKISSLVSQLGMEFLGHWIVTPDAERLVEKEKSI